MKNLHLLTLAMLVGMGSTAVAYRNDTKMKSEKTEGRRSHHNKGERKARHQKGDMKNKKSMKKEDGKKRMHRTHKQRKSMD